MGSFEESFKKQAKKHWDKAREAEVGDVGRIRLEPGEYVGVLTTEQSVLEKGVLAGCSKLLLTYTVTQGDSAGEKATKTFLFGGDRTEQELTKLARLLKKMFPADASDLASSDAEGLLEFLAAELFDQTIPVIFEVIEDDIQDKKTKETRRIKWVDVIRVLDEDSDTPSSDDEGSDSDSDGEGDDDWTPEKGETVMYQPPGKRKLYPFDVVDVSLKKGTVTLDNGDDEDLEVPISMVFEQED